MAKGHTLWKLCRRPGNRNLSIWGRRTMMMRGISRGTLGALTKQTNRLSLYLAYAMEWDDKLNMPRALPPHHWKLVLFKLIFPPLVLITTGFIIKLFYTKLGNDPRDKINFILTVLATCCIGFQLPMACTTFLKDASIQVGMHRIVWNTEDWLTGMLTTREIDPEIDHYLKYSYYRAKRFLVFLVVYMMPVMSLLFSYTTYNPLYTLFMWVLQMDPYSEGLDALAMRYLIAGPLTVGNTPNLVTYLVHYAMLVGFGTYSCYLWDRYLIPAKLTGKFRGGVGFEKAVQMYRALDLLAKFHTETNQNFVTPCLHQPMSVAICTMCAYGFISELSQESRPPSTFLLIVATLAFIATVIIEYMAVYGMAKGSEASKEFLRMTKLHYATKDKYRRKLLESLLPTCVNLEIACSVETMKGGIGMDYFLNFVDRVTGYTVDLLLAYQ